MYKMAVPVEDDKELQEMLVKRSIEVKSKAFVPYSNFAVGAALLTATGEIYTGWNKQH